MTQSKKKLIVIDFIAIMFVGRMETLQLLQGILEKKGTSAVGLQTDTKQREKGLSEDPSH